MSRFDLICFDLDGTLVETAPEILDAVNDTLAALHLPAVTQAQVERWIGHGTRELLLHALADACGCSAAEVRARSDLADIAHRFDGHYARRCGTRSRLYPGAREALDRLRDHGVRLALVTNKEWRHAQGLLHAHQLETRFDCVIGGDTLPSKKPDPAGVARCMRTCSVAPRRTLFVGDSSIDAATARNAGVSVWLLSHGYNMGRPLAECAPDRIIDNFAALTESLLAQPTVST